MKYAGSAPDGNFFWFGGQVGYYTEFNTSIYLMSCGARWYHPQIGRWLSRDPIGYDGGDNLYAYCGGDPVNRADPSGTVIIELRFRPVFGLFGETGYHAYIVVTDRNGFQWYFSAGPDPNGKRGGSTTTRSGPFIWGKSYDWNPNNGEKNDECKRPRVTLLKNDQPAKAYVDLLSLLSRDLDDSRLPYFFMGPNSTSAARWLISRIGLLNPDLKRNRLPVFAPAWNYRIDPNVTNGKPWEYRLPPH